MARTPISIHPVPEWEGSSQRLGANARVKERTPMRLKRSIEKCLTGKRSNSNNSPSAIDCALPLPSALCGSADYNAHANRSSERTFFAATRMEEGVSMIQRYGMGTMSRRHMLKAMAAAAGCALAPEAIAFSGSNWAPTKACCSISGARTYTPSG